MAKRKRRAKVISSRLLNQTIDKAVTDALKRYDLKASVEETNLMASWRIIGRMRVGNDIANAMEFAESVTAKVNRVAGISAIPAIARVPGGTLMGFFDTGQQMQEIG